MCFGGGGNSSDALAQAEAQRQSLISQGMGDIDKAFSRFTPDFYSGIEKTTLASLIPQLGDQTLQARRNLAFGLSGRGLSRSFASEQERAAFEKQKALNQTFVANQAIEAGNQTMAEVQRQKSELVSQLQASSAPASLASGIVQTAASIRPPSLLAPLGNMFAQWGTNYLAGRMNPVDSTSPYDYKSPMMSEDRYPNVVPKLR